MYHKIQYETPAEKETLLRENESKYLIEEQNLFDGNFLIFSEERPVDPQIEVQTLKTKVAQLEELVNTMLGV